MVVLTRQRKFVVPFQIEIEGQKIKSVMWLKYLGVFVDAKLKFWVQIKETAEKAATVLAMLSRLMPNITWPRSSKSRILMSVTHYIILYGAEIWAEALNVEKYAKKLANV
ncbi:uncharacterized protein LOC117170757 [Belonocnema kinseyi]|uniref:uncharacterized protein LOC117170757 n=1 Tax=Belonocnema kinseyi TaxID=2817044 RepID=UPI00143D0EF4|nr:uncharacterized protein LOC117170757 [Belonocnema kinseyi]